MASKVMIVREDDLTGEQLEPGRGETITFALDGQAYEIDLSGNNATELRQSLRRYIGAARETSPASRRGARRSASGVGQTRRDTTAIRAWAREQGHEISDRGRVPTSLITAYAAAH